MSKQATKKILVNDENLSSILNDAQTKLGARVRWLDADTVTDAVAAATAKLRALGLPQKLWTGTVVHVPAGYTVPSSYSYPAHETSATVRCVAGQWRVTSIDRTGVSGSPQRPALVLTERAHADAVRRLSESRILAI